MSEPKPLGYDSVLKALKAHSNAVPGVTKDELDAGFVAFQNETDRGAVILGATTLEDKLTQCFQASMGHLNADERSRLFGWDGPLGTFSAKVRLAHALNHFDRQGFKMAEVIREMRNACAHSRQDISFKDEALRNAIYLLAKMANVKIPDDGDAKMFRTLFLTFIAWLVHQTIEKDEKLSFGVFLVEVTTNFRKQHPSYEETPLERLSPENPENRKGA